MCRVDIGFREDRLRFDGDIGNHLESDRISAFRLYKRVDVERIRQSTNGNQDHFDGCRVQFWCEFRVDGKKVDCAR